MPQDVQSTLKDPKFLALGPDDQVAVLKALRTHAAATPAPDTNTADLQKFADATGEGSVAKGFVERAKQTAKGFYETFKPPATTGDETASAIGGPGGLAVKRIGQGAFEAGKSKAAQASEELATGHPIRAAARTAFEVNPLSPIGPLSPLQSQADLVEQGRYREAIGSAAFDALTFLVGKKLGAGPTEKAASAKLALGTGADVTDLRKVLPDLQKTAETGGKPATVGDLKAVVRDTTDRLDAEFNQDFDAIKWNRIYTPFIRQRLQKILADNPQWAKTPEGLAKRSAVQDAITTYDRTGWTFEEMNKERSDLRTSIRALKKMAPSGEHAARKVNAEIAAKEATADVMSETTHDWLSHSSGKPKLYYDELRRKQAALIDIEDHLTDEVGKLAQKQALHEAAGPIGRFKLHAYVSPSSSGFLRAHASGLHEAVSAGPEAAANAQVRGAFTSSKHPYASAGVMSLPLDALTERDKEDVRGAVRRSAIPPPPTLPE